MKIIGISGTPNDRCFLVEATAREVAQIAGFGYEGAEDFSKFIGDLGGLDRDGRVKVGVEIPVGNNWGHLSSLRSGEAKLKELGGTLHALGSLVEAALPSIVVPIVEPTEE